MTWSLGQEHHGHGGSKLLHASRLQRDPARYIDRFGRAAYDMMLADCLWHVYALIGKLTRRIYVLSSPGKCSGRRSCGDEA